MCFPRLRSDITLFVEPDFLLQDQCLGYDTKTKLAAFIFPEEVLQFVRLFF
jgi:hypothetical protein